MLHLDFILLIYMGSHDLLHGFQVFILYPTLFWTQHFLVPKILFGPKYLLDLIFWTSNFLDPDYFSIPYRFRPKFLLGLKFVCNEKSLDQKSFWTQNTSLVAKGNSLTACNAAPPPKSKMAARGPQNGRRGLERCLPQVSGAPVNLL